MQVEIVKRADARVLGILARIDPKTADYGELWMKRFMPRAPEIAALATTKSYYGVYYGTDQPGIVDFIAGMLVGEIDQVAEGLTLRDLPGGEFAVFPSTMEAIGATWRKIYGEWLPASTEYVEDETRACFEEYPPETSGPKSPLEIFVPVRRK